MLATQPSGECSTPQNVDAMRTTDDTLVLVFEYSEDVPSEETVALVGGVRAEGKIVYVGQSYYMIMLKACTLGDDIFLWETLRGISWADGYDPRKVVVAGDTCLFRFVLP